MKNYLLTTKIAYLILVFLTLLFVYFGSRYSSPYLNLSISKIIPSTSSIIDKNILLNSIRSDRFEKVSKNYQGLSLAYTSNLTAKSIPVIYYHGINKNQNEEGVSPEEFRNEMYALKANGYQTVTLSELDIFLRNGIELPAKSFVLTFDDGRKDSYANADPILEEIGYFAVMFVIGDTSEKENNFHLSKDELKSMHNSGRWDLQSHSYALHKFTAIDNSGKEGHALANKIWIETENRLETDDEYAARIRTDLEKSKYLIEEISGSKAKAFAFPYGDFAQNDTNCSECKEIVLSICDQLFELNFYQAWGDKVFRNYPSPQNNLVKRIGREEFSSPEELVRLLEYSIDKPKTIKHSLNEDIGWVNASGFINIENDGLTITSDSSDVQSITYLSGTNLYSNNINFQADIRLVKGTSYELLTFINNNNYIGCKYADGKVSTVWKNNDKYSSTEETTVDYRIADFNNSTTIVSNDEIYCLLDNKVILKETLPSDIEKKGYIGIGVSSQNNESASVNLRNINIH